MTIENKQTTQQEAATSLVILHKATAGQYMHFEELTVKMESDQMCTMGRETESHGMYASNQGKVA